MKRISVVLFLLVSELSAQKLFNLEPLNTLNVGVDFSQVLYYVSSKGTGVNLGVSAQYKPYNFVELNASIISNHVRKQGGIRHYNAFEYYSKGYCVKIGATLSARISQKYRTKRIFLGWNTAFASIEEKGSFSFPDLYWSPYVFNIESKRSFIGLDEIVCGLQFPIKKTLLKIQLYSILAKDEARISYIKNDQIGRFYSPFIPGFGYRRGGLNLMLLFPIGWGND